MILRSRNSHGPRALVFAGACSAVLACALSPLDAQIKDVYPDKARFQPGGEVKISVDLGNDGGSSLSGRLRVKGPGPRDTYG